MRKTDFEEKLVELRQRKNDLLVELESVDGLLMAFNAVSGALNGQKPAQPAALKVADVHVAPVFNDAPKADPLAFMPARLVGMQPADIVRSLLDNELQNEIVKPQAISRAILDSKVMGKKKLPNIYATVYAVVTKDKRLKRVDAGTYRWS